MVVKVTGDGQDGRGGQGFQQTLPDSATVVNVLELTNIFSLFHFLSCLSLPPSSLLFLCPTHFSHPLRLSGDVQELKSSFKLVVGQGLRSATQVLGSVVSLFYISPQMTGVVGVTLPCIVAMGTFLGSILWRWSRQVQEQVAIATGVADEAIGNIRTVSAFALEDSKIK